MGVLSRFTNYIRTVMSHMLDRAEDPGQTLDYSYEKQLEQLQNLKRAFADVVTSKKRLELQEAQIQSQMAHYDDAARTALAQGREDLARLALERKQGLQAQLASFDQQIGQLNEQQAKIDTLQQRLTARVEAFRTQKEMVKAQYGAAQAQVRIQEAATGLSEEMQDVNLAVQRAQDKVLTMQARANALDELTESGALPELNAPGTGDDIDRQLAAMSNKSEVDRQLEALNSQMQLPGAQGPAQLPPAGQAAGQQ